MTQKLVLSPDTFIWDNRQSILIFGSHNGDYVLIKNTTSELLSICDSLRQPRQLYEVEFDDEKISSVTMSILKQICDKGLGKIVNTDINLVSIQPILVIQNNAEKIRSDNTGKYQLLNYLHSVLFYVGGPCPEVKYSSQIVYPVNSEKNLSISDITSFLTKCDSSFITNVGVVISKPDTTFVENLLNSLAVWKDLTALYVLFTGEQSIIDFISSINSLHVKLHLIIDDKNVRPKLDNLLSLPYPSMVSLDFIVRSEQEYEEYLRLSQAGDFIKFKALFSPISDNNEKFISTYVQLTEDEILSTRLSRRNIYIHQSMNINDWGCLSVLPDGTVSINPYSRAIGHISDSIYDLIANALSDDIWLNIRRKKKCRNCLYRWLCPSPSRIEDCTKNHLICNFQ